MENFAQICKMSTIRTRRIYSESFKKSKVEQIEKGEITALQLSKMLGLQSSSTIYEWIKKYSKRSLNEKVVIETESDYLRFVELEKQTAQMEQMIGQQQIKLQFYEELIAQIRAHYGEDPVELFLKK